MTNRTVASNVKQDIVKLSIPAKPEFVSIARLAISGIATRMNFTIEEIEDLKLAVSEACTNAVQHAYTETSGMIDITCTLESETLTMIVQDYGVGFDPKSLGTAEQTQRSHDRKGLGLGLTFIKGLMDDLTIESVASKGTTVKISKKRTLTNKQS